MLRASPLYWRFENCKSGGLASGIFSACQVRDITRGMRNRHQLSSSDFSAKYRVFTPTSCRRIMGVLSALAVAAFVGFTLPRRLASQNFTDLTPSPQQVEWQDLEFGVIVHFGLNSFTDK